jgi:hypothetical protein
MAQRAAARARVEWDREEAAEAERARAEDAALAEEQRAEFETGPPGGCHACWSWVRGIFGGRYSWEHNSVSEGHLAGARLRLKDFKPPYDCGHGCHGGEPYHVGAPVAIG